MWPSRLHTTDTECNLLDIPKTQSFNYVFKTRPTVYMYQEQWVQVE